MKNSNIVLTGFMASGKTTVGELLSDITGKKLVDTDLLVEERAQMSIREIFEREGEPRFRELERLVVGEVSGGEGSVIALGGGAVVDPENVRRLREKGVIYLLDVSPGEVARRAGDDSERPLLGEKRRDIEELMRARLDAYRRAADVIIDTTGREARQVAATIAGDFEARESGEEGSK